GQGAGHGEARTQGEARVQAWEPDQARPRRVPPARPDLQPLTPAEGAGHLDDPTPHPLPVPVAGFPSRRARPPEVRAPGPAAGWLSVGGRAGRPRSST